MRETSFKIENREIEYIEVSILSGNANVDTFSFTFDSEWEGLTKTLVLQNNGQPYLANLIEDKAVIPAGVYHDGFMSFGVYGRNQEDEVVLSSLMYTLEIHDGAYVYSGNPQNLPDKSTWDEYTDIMLGLVAQGQLTLENCQQVLSDMQSYYTDAKEEITGIKNDTKDYRDEAQDILADCEDVKQDIIDMGSARTFATFYLDPKTGHLYVVNAESLGNMNFYLENKHLFVKIKTEV